MDLVLTILIRFLVFLSGFAKPLSRLGLCRYAAWQPGEPIELLMVGYNGARNTGADARVAAIAEQIRDVFGEGKAHITVMTLDEDNLAGYFAPDVTLLPFSSIFPFHLFRACCRSHAAILCEGSTLKSTFADALTLFFCEASGIMARQGKPCIAYGSEVGHMNPRLRRTAQRLCADTYFITRTAESQRALEELGLRGHIGTDTAWRYSGAIPPEAAEELLRQAGWDGTSPMLGVAAIDPFCWPVKASLSRWLKGKLTGRMEGQYDKWYFFSDSAARRAAFEHYISALAEAAAKFCRAHGCFPVLIGMERLDAKACGILREKLGLPCAVIVSGEHPAGEMTGVLRRLSRLATSRYHAAVLSMAAGIPIAAVSMDERLDSLMRELSFERDFLHRVDEPELGARLYASLEKGLQRQEEIARHIGRAYESYQARLDAMGRFLLAYITEGLL